MLSNTLRLKIMAEMKRKFQGIFIPAELWLNRDLNITEKAMLVEIASLEDEVKGCFAGNAYFADFFALSKNRISEIVRSLESKGYVRVELEREGRMVSERRIFLLNDHFYQNYPAHVAPIGSRKTDEGCSENREEILTTESKQHINTSCPENSFQDAKVSSRKYSFNEADMTAARYIADKVDALAGSPGKHNLQSWANTIRLMRERDGRNHREICDLFKWANRDNFWKDNVLSPETLRKQWQKLTIRRNSERNGTTAARPALDFNNTDWADKLGE
jgi:Mn-dependent DtxR family transcriptional regulator